MADQVDAAIYRLKVEGLDQIKKADDAIAALTATQDKQTESSNRMTAASKKAGDSEATVTVTETKQTAARRTSTDQLQRWIASMDAATRVAMQHEKALARLKQYETDQVGTATERAKALQLLTDRHKEQVKALEESGRATVDFGDKLTRIGTGILMGRSSLRLVSQQLRELKGDITEAGGVVPYLGAVFRSLVSPTTLVVGVFAAVAAAIALVIYKANQLAAQSRELNTSLVGIGKGGQTTVEGLNKVTDALVKMGIAREEAVKAQQVLIRSPGERVPVDDASRQRIIAAAQQQAAIQGTDTVTETKALAEAIQGGTKALQEYLIARTKATAEELKAVDTGMKTKGSIGAVNAALDALNRNVADDTHRENLSEWGKAWEDFGIKLDSVGKSIAEGPLGRTLKWLSDSVAKGIQYTMGGKDQTVPPAPPEWTGLPGIQPGAPGFPATAKIPPVGSLSRVGFTEKAATQGVGSGGADIQQLAKLLEMSSSVLKEGQRFEIFSAHRPGDVGSMHGSAAAVDVRIVDSSGKPINTGVIGRPSMMGGLGGAAGLPDYDVDRAMVAAAKILGVSISVGSLFRDAKGPDPGHYGIGAQHIEVQRNLDKQGQLATLSRGGVPGDTRAGQLSVLDQREKANKDLEIARIRGSVALEAAKAQEAAYQEELTKTGDKTAAITAGLIAKNKVLAENNITVSKAAEVDKDLANANRDVANAYQVSKAQGIEAEAHMKVLMEMRAQYGRGLLDQAEVDKRISAELKKGAAEALAATAKNLPALIEQADAQEKLAEASGKTAKAEKEAEQQSKASAATSDLLAKAIATKDDALIKEAQTLHDATLAQIKRNDAAAAGVKLNQQISQNTDAVQVVQLETSLQGQSAEFIAAQVEHLKAKQLLEREGVDLSYKTAQNYFKSVDGLSQANKELAEAKRASAALDDAVKSAADSVVNQLGTAMGDIFSGKKVQDWGSMVKSTIQSIIQNLATSMIIKPLVGSVLSSIGFGNVGAQFGSLGGTLGGLGNLFGGGGSGSTDLVQKDKEGNVVGTISSAASTVKGGGGLLGELGLSGGESSIGSFFDKGLGGIFASGKGADLVPGSVFGNTTLGQFGSGVGLGFAGGSLLNGLMGGNQTTGTIGSGIGSLAGTAIGSFVGLPMVGGLLGGAAGGLLGGMFGQNKKPDAASGGVINLATGKISNVQSSGNAQNDATANQIGTVLGGAVARALAIPGAHLPGGAVAVQAGSRDGIKLSFGGMEQKFKSADEAIAFGLNALRDNLTGVSDTVQKVIHSIGSPEQIEGALAFADAYDKLSEAASEAFKEVEAGSKTIGPFETAMNQIRTIFDGMRQQAEQYGLSIEPINAALEEATRRLNVDFAKAVDTAFNAATGRTFLTSIQGIIDGYEQMARDASAIGAGRDIHDKLGATYIAELNTAFAELTGPQLDEVIAKFGSLSGVLPDLARAAKEAADAAAALTRETERQAAAYQIQQDADTAAGKGFLAQLRDLDKTRIASQANAKSLDLGDTRQGMIAETQHRASLTVLQELTNEQLEDARKTLAELNPAFAAWVDEVKAMTKATQDASDAQARSTKILEAQANIQAYLNSLQTQQSVFTDPKSRLQASQSQYNTMLAAAQGGDADALAGITGAAQTLLQNVSDYYASTAPGQAIFQQVQAQLQGLLGTVGPARVTATTNDVVAAIEDTGIDTAAAIGSGSTSVVSASITASQKITDNAVEMSTSIITAAKKANDAIVAVTITSGASMTNATLEGTALIVGGTAQGFTAQTATLMTGTGTVVASTGGTTAAVIAAGTDATSASKALLDQNVKNAGELIANNTQNAIDTITASENNAGLLRDASISQTNAILASNVASAETIKQRTTETTDKLITANDTHTTKLVEKAQETTNQTVATATANTAAIMAQNDAATQESIATLNAQTASIVDTASAKSDALLAKTGTVADAAAALSAANTAALAAKADAQIAGTAAALATTTTTLDAAQKTASAAVIANTSATTDKAIGAQAAASAAVTAQATADSNAVMGTQAAWSAYSIDQANAASRAAAASASGDAQAIIASQVAWDNAILGNLVGWFQAAINSQVAWDNAINNSVVAWLNLTVTTIAAYGNALLGQGGGTAGYIAGYIAAYGQATIDTIGAHIRWLVDVLADKAQWLVGTVAGWGNNVYAQIAIWSQGVINATSGGFGWLNDRQNERVNGVIATVANWSNAIIQNQVAWDNAQIGQLSWGFNAIINQAGANTNGITGSIWGAINNLIGANWGNANWINGTLNVYGNAIISNIAGTSNNEIGAIYGAANSINGTIAAYAGWMVDNINARSGDATWWLSNVYNAVNNVNGNEVAWNQNLYNIVNATRDTLNYWFDRLFGEVQLMGNYIQLLTEITIEYDQWMAHVSGAQLDQMNAIKDAQRKAAFG